MMSKWALATLAVIISCVSVHTTLLPVTNRNPGDAHVHHSGVDQFQTDPDYRILEAWHAADPEGHPREPWRDLLAELASNPHETLEQRVTRTKNLEAPGDLPDTFDARQKWKKCKRLIGTIYDQGPCRSDYAIAAASTVADRFCIAKSGKFKTLLSAQRVLGCYSNCTGGYIWPTFMHISNNGIPTGGLHKPKRGCMPFEPEPCSHKMEFGWGEEGLEVNVALPNCSTFDPKKAYECHKDCPNKKYKKKLSDDLHYIERVGWTPENEAKIREEILKNGPVGAAFSMYSDFKDYTSGIYKVKSNAHYDYIRKIKIIGWGKENGEDYWLCVNSFNKDWGMKGLFKFPRGKNYLYIETLVVTFDPRL